MKNRDVKRSEYNFNKVAYSMKEIIQRIQKWFVTSKLFHWYKERRYKRYHTMGVEEVFSAVYRENTWGGNKGEFYSGTGTDDSNTATYIEALVHFIRENNIKSITEVGCGDFSIMNRVLSKLSDVKYTGLDVVSDLIQYNNANFGTERIQFVKCNAIDEALPKSDLLIIRQVLQHLKNREIQLVLDKSRDFRFAMITEHVPITDNVMYNLDKSTGPHIRMRLNSGVFIDKPPFSINNSSVLLEYRCDDPVKKKMVPAVMRTFVVQNEDLIHKDAAFHTRH